MVLDLCDESDVVRWVGMSQGVEGAMGVGHDQCGTCVDTVTVPQRFEDGDEFGLEGGGFIADPKHVGPAICHKSCSGSTCFGLDGAVGVDNGVVFAFERASARERLLSQDSRGRVVLGTR